MAANSTTGVQRRTIAFQHLDEAVADARNLSKGYQQAGDWSLAQNLDHLIKAMQIAFDGIDWSLPWLMRPVVRFMYLKKVRTGSSTAIGMRANAPPSLQPSAADEDVEGLLATFAELAAKIESPDAKFIEAHPVFGKLDNEDWRWVQRWHCAHHLSHLVPNQVDGTTA